MDTVIKRIKSKIEHNGFYVNEVISKEKIREFEKKTIFIYQKN